MKFLAVAMALCASVLLTFAAPAAVQAADGDPCGDARFLTFPAWYNGLTVQNGEDCDIVAPGETGTFSTFVWKIVLNIVEILLNASGYAAVAASCKHSSVAS
jgi:hypothetical protein